jgi:hypothetical protein
MKKSLVELAAAVAVLLALIFIAGCHGFSVSSQSCGACRFIYNYQTLITGVLALTAAAIASVPVFAQVRMARAQSAVMTREVLIQRLRNVGARQRMVAGIVSAITDDFTRAIYPDSDGGEADIHPEWANNAGQEVHFAVAKLKKIQRSRVDPAEINSERENLILVAEKLAECLNYIPVPGEAPWEDGELGMSEEEQANEEAKADAQAKSAEGELTGKIVAVKRAGKLLDDAYTNLLEALRTQLRRIDDSILERET